MNVNNNNNLSQEDRWKKLQEWKQSKQIKPATTSILKNKENSSQAKSSQPAVVKVRRATEHDADDKEQRLKNSVNKLQLELSEAQSQLQELQVKSAKDAQEIAAVRAELEEKKALVKQYAVRYVPESLLQKALDDLMEVQQDRDEYAALLDEAQGALSKKSLSEMDLVTQVAMLKEDVEAKDLEIIQLQQALTVTLEDNEKLYQYIEVSGPPVDTIDVALQTESTLTDESSSQTMYYGSDVAVQVQPELKDQGCQVESTYVIDDHVNKKAKYSDESIQLVAFEWQMKTPAVDPDLNLSPPKNQAYYAFGKYQHKPVQQASNLKNLVNFVDYQEEAIQTDQDPIYAKADSTIKEFSSMKFANALMMEQMVQQSQKHREEIKPLKRDSQKIQQYQEELTKHQRRLKQLLENKAHDEQRIKDLEQLVTMKQQENEVLVANIGELMAAVEESDDDDE